MIFHDSQGGDGKEQQIVILEKVGQQIKYYRYGDPEKSIRTFNTRKCKIVREKENYLEGYLLKDSKDSISILVTNETRIILMEKDHIMVENVILNYIV